MTEFTIRRNYYLNQNIQAFYHTDYVGYRNPGNPNYINTLKNTFNAFPQYLLNSAVRELRNVLLEDLPQIIDSLQLDLLTVCVVPRAKAEINYNKNQLLFKSTVRDIVNELPDSFCNGTDYIVRHSNTKTTHLRRPIEGFSNDGDGPYRGITARTCNISNEVRNKNILLIDDLYTRSVNIDEDAIQALLNYGANTVVFYSVGKTFRPSTELC